ncbi:hypothetical protein QCA50_000074 [Cerrena zonata]|uniref:Pentatricopeptide repeat-containing protein n=1 Tax=Cerrena zonata TaxID=2478898 RepID=A0AAW0GPV9_9APHY
MLRTASPSISATQRHLQTSLTSTVSRHIATSTGTASSSTSSPEHAPPSKSSHRYPRDGKLRAPYIGKNIRLNKVLSDGRRLLLPYDLSQKLRTLCKEGQHEEAIELLKTSPADAQNTVVWNTLISQLLGVRKYKASYQLYVEMKRRGFQPNIRTYSTLLAGLSTVQDWKVHSNQLENAHKLYEGFMEFAERLEKTDLKYSELNIAPVNSYLLILTKANCHQKVFDVYNAMKDSGPLAPDHFTYSILFNALRQRGEVDNESNLGIHRQNASDARLLWKQMVRASERSTGFVFDSYILAPVIQVLYRGSPSDQLMAFDIIREYLGLSKPGEPEVKGRIPLDSRLFFCALDACVRTQKHRLALHWMQQMMEKPVKQGEKPLIEHRHMEQMLLAYGSLASIGSMNESQQALNAVEWAIRNSVLHDHPYLRPSQKMYQLAMAACWRCTDWDAAMRLFELMTGYEAKDFTDDVTAKPHVHKRSEGFNLTPMSPTLCTMARTAVSTGDPAKMRQCLRILTRYGADHIFVNATGKGEHADFYITRAAEAILRLVDGVLKKGEVVEEVRHEEAKRWIVLKVKAREIVRAQKMSQGGLRKPLPPLEDSLLGSSKLLDETEEQINLSYDRRTSAPAKRF